MKHKNIKYSILLDAAAKNVNPVEQISKNDKITLDEAYAIQKNSIATRLERGERLSGIKLGFTSKAKMEQMGVHDLIWGRLTDGMEIKNGGDLILNNFIHPRVEPEIAYLLEKDIAEPISEDNVLDYVSNVAAAIEIIDSRYKNFKFSLEDVIADNCSSSGYVIGDWKDFSIDVSNLQMKLQVDDKVVQSGNSSAILGNPLNSLLEAFRLANQYGVHLKKGMVILAGAATPAVFVKENNFVAVEVENLGRVSLNVK